MRFKASIQRFLACVTVAAIEEKHLRAAIKSPFSDFEDAAWLDCAREAGCDVILSSDRRLAGFARCPVYAPEDFCRKLFGE